jgi:hypothetical protein
MNFVMQAEAGRSIDHPLEGCSSVSNNHPSRKVLAQIWLYTNHEVQILDHFSIIFGYLVHLPSIPSRCTNGCWVTYNSVYFGPETQDDKTKAMGTPHFTPHYPPKNIIVEEKEQWNH